MPLAISSLSREAFVRSPLMYSPSMLQPSVPRKAVFMRVTMAGKSEAVAGWRGMGMFLILAGIWVASRSIVMRCGGEC